MSEETKTEETKGAEETKAEAKVRTRVQREMQTYVWTQVGGGPNWKVAAGPFVGLAEAETWIEKSGKDGQYYWPLRGPEKAHYIEPRRVMAVVPNITEPAAAPAAPAEA